MNEEIESAERRVVAELMAYALVNSNTLYFTDAQSIIRDVGLSQKEAVEFIESIRAGGIAVGVWSDLGEIEEYWETDPSTWFFNRLRHDLLTKEEEIELGLVIRKGREARDELERLADELEFLEPAARTQMKRTARIGEDAREKFITSNLRLARSVAVRYVVAAGYSLTIDDLFQECFFALNRAVDLWDPDRGFRFSTYAVNWIRQTLGRLIANQSRVIRLPVHVHDEIRKLESAMSKFELTNQRLATVSELAELLKEPVAQISSLLSIRDDAQLLAWPEGIRPISDEIDFNYWDCGDRFWSGEIGFFAVELVEEALRTVLKPREFEVICRRFGFGGAEPETLESIGGSFRVTRERVRQIEGKALAKLKTSVFAEDLASLIDSTFFDEPAPGEMDAGVPVAPSDSIASAEQLKSSLNSKLTAEREEHTKIETGDAAKEFRQLHGFELTDNFAIDVDGVKPFP